MDTNLEISIKLGSASVDGNKVISAPLVKIFINGEQIGLVSRLRIDAQSDDMIPAVEIDMLKGVCLDSLSKDLQEKVKAWFEELRKIPGVKCRMPAPRQ